MANYYLIAIRDIRANIYSMMETTVAIELAVRGFEDRCNSGDQKDLVARHPQDFELVLLGEYEDHTGTILVYEIPDRKQIAAGGRKVTQ